MRVCDMHLRNYLLTYLLTYKEVFSLSQCNSVAAVSMQATFKGWMEIMKHAIDGNEVSRILDIIR